MSSPDRAAMPSSMPGAPPSAKPPTREARPASCSPKIRDHHLTRVAIVYVRQSTPQQVLEHRESRERQYALAGEVVALGWPEDRVLIIDEDQGQSGRTAEARAGFQRLVAEVTMNHVGLIAGLEMSRLARSNGDWHHLFELCAVFQTLLADQDGVYDAKDANDRLILGLKGMMSEVELLTMRNRLERGRLHKAERGELFPGGMPVGYVKLASGQVELDPDEQVQAVVRLIFDKFDELGSAWAVFQYLVRHDIRLGFRPFRGARRGQLEWRRAVASTVLDLLQHPLYAGAYAYGRRPVDPRRQAAGPAKARQCGVPMAEWKVLKRDHLPAYITWERYLENQARMQQNRSSSDAPGTARQGGALLTGLVICGTCGRRLHVSHGAPGKAHYHCVQHLVRGTEQTCHGLRAAVVDDLVVAQVLRALEPAALAVSMQAVEVIQKERGRLDSYWGQQLERARYEVERAERQYRAVEPENRLVARTLERRWEEVLQSESRLKEDYDRFVRERPPQLSPADRTRIQALAEDIPALWRAPGTTAADRKEVIRCLVKRVVVQVRPDSEHVGVTIHWQGDFVSEHQVLRPVQGYEQLEEFDRLVSRIVELREQGQRAAMIAAKLNEEGYRTPKMRGDFQPQQVRKLLSRWHLARGTPAPEQRGPQEWLLADLGREVGVTTEKLREWIRQGWLHGRQTAARGLWIAWADRDELKRLRKLRARSRRGVGPYPKELTTPKKRNTK